MVNDCSVWGASPAPEPMTETPPRFPRDHLGNKAPCEPQRGRDVGPHDLIHVLPPQVLEQPVLAHARIVDEHVDGADARGRPHNQRASSRPATFLRAPHSAPTGRPPRHQVRRVQTLASKQSADLAGLRAGVGLLLDLRLVLGGQAPPLGLGRHFRREARGNRKMVDVVTSSRRLLALYTKRRTGSCLTHVGREGRPTRSDRWRRACARHHCRA